MKKLDVKGSQVSQVNEDSDPIDIALNKYVNHLVYLKKRNILMNLLSNFLEVIPNEITK